MENLEEWSTDSLILENITQNYQGQLALQKPDDGIRIVPEVVDVEMLVERYTEKDIFVRVVIRNPPAGADSIRLFPDKALIKCVIGLRHYNDLSSKDFRLIEDLKKTYIREGKSTVPVEFPV